MSLFVVSPEIEDRDEVEVATWQSTKRPSTLNDISILFSSSGSQKKFGHELTYLFFFSCSYINKFVVFKALVISTSLVIGT
jgi:hypothetical protein